MPRTRKFKANSPLSHTPPKGAAKREFTKSPFLSITQITIGKQPVWDRHPAALISSRGPLSRHARIIQHVTRFSYSHGLAKPYPFWQICCTTGKHSTKGMQNWYSLIQVLDVIQSQSKLHCLLHKVYQPDCFTCHIKSIGQVWSTE